jgi:hypothetical protein
VDSPLLEPCPRRSASFRTATAALLWFAFVAAAMVGIVAYSSEPGSTGTAPTDWPTESRLAGPSDRPLLVLFAHPRCPCTRASLGELARLMGRFRGRFDAHVVFLKAESTGKDWAHTDLWRSAAAIPGVAVHPDDAGTEARRFGAETSGQTLVYDRAGHLRFQGGITASRGHEGENAGTDAIAGILDSGGPQTLAMPVFGCDLFEPGSGERSAACRTTR